MKNNDIKILSLSLDPALEDENSAVHARSLEYGELVEKLCIVFPAKRSFLKKSGNVEFFGVGGNKLQKAIGMYKAAGKALQRESFSLITVQDMYFLGLIAFFLSRRFHVPLEVQVHGFEKFFSFRRILAQFVLKHADALRTVSKRLETRLHTEFGVPLQTITVVPIFSQGAELKDETIKKDPNSFVFLTVARLVPVKNIASEIEAFSEVSKMYGKARLWIVGDGEERARLEHLSESLGLKEKIVFYGRQSDVSELYQKADAFVLFSLAEGWPLVIMEAASAALPIIMSDTGSANEFLIDGENGIVVPVGNKEILAEKMRLLIENENVREGLGRKAKESFHRLPTKKEILDLYVQSWQLALKKNQ